MATEAQLETLSTALTAYQLASMAADSAPSLVTGRAEAHAGVRLQDAAVACGMPLDSDFVQWSAERLAKWWMAA